jgi:hypothetical protein
MKTPWSNLLQYGIGVTTVIVLAIGGIIMLSIVGLAVVLSKISVLIK